MKISDSDFEKLLQSEEKHSYNKTIAFQGAPEKAAGRPVFKRLAVVAVAALLAAGLIALGVLTAAKTANHGVPTPPDVTETVPAPGTDTETADVPDTNTDPVDSETGADSTDVQTEPVDETTEPVTQPVTEEVTTSEKDKDPKTALFTAAEIGELFSGQEKEDMPTNAYVKIYVPSDDELKYYYTSVPSGNTVGVYNLKTTDIQMNMYDWPAVKYLEKICDGLGVSYPDYDNNNRYFISFTNYDYVYFLSFTQRWNRESLEQKIVFDGVDITVDQRLSDEQIKAALKPIKDKLCKTFDVDLPDICIKRNYDSYSEHGCKYLNIYFYNAENNKVDFDVCRCSDYISLEFDNASNFGGDIVSDGVLQVVTVRFAHYNCEPEAICEKNCDAELITLEEAEELLHKGYCFGGHICPLCMASQDKVSFEDYDKVGLVYFEGMPFYAFFKNLQYKSTNGNITYARTLVPAVEVSGYEEYFEAQEAFHNGYNG